MGRVAIVLAVCLAALAAPGAGVLGAPAAAAAPDPGSAEAEFVARINALRATHGLAPLTVDAGLVDVARRWAAKMANVDRISHNRGLTAEVTADWDKLGENVGVGMTVAKLHHAFVASPTHHRNLVDRDFTHIGVGVVIGRGGALFTAHQFMQLRGVAAPAPRPAAAPGELAAAPPLGGPTPRLVRVLAQLHELDAA